MKRRDFLQATLFSSIGLSGLSCSKSPDVSHDLGIMVSAASDRTKNYYLCQVDLATKEYIKIPVEQRGHSICSNPIKRNIATLISRRPGNLLTQFDLFSGEIVQQQFTSSDRHLYGHACHFNHDEYLLTTENDFDAGVGRIAIRDNNLKVIDEISSFGIGPHDLGMLPDGKTLVVANGGIQTHPVTSNQKLNLATMEPSLTYIDLESGRLIDAHSLKDPKYSIRHIDVDSMGMIGVATQYQSRQKLIEKNKSLVGYQQDNDQINIFSIPNSLANNLNLYTADFIFSRDSTAAVSAPRGNQVLFFNTKNNVLINHISLDQPSALGLSSNQKYFVISTANGQIHFVDCRGCEHRIDMTIEFPSLIWDNHMSII